MPQEIPESDPRASVARSVIAMVTAVEAGDLVMAAHLLGEVDSDQAICVLASMLLESWRALGALDGERVEERLQRIALDVAANA